MARYRFGTLFVALLFASFGLNDPTLWVKVWSWSLMLACAVSMFVFWRFAKHE
jgi:hypothetical protein